MSRLITVRADSNIEGYTDITLPLMEKKAKEWNADFVRLTEEYEYSDYSDGRYHYRILELYNLYEKYDRILNLDADMLIKDNCPNPFAKFSEDVIVTCLEDKGSRQLQRAQTLHEIQRKFGGVGWTKDYINTGFFLTSKKHRDIFQKIDDEVWNGFGFDDVLLGYNIHKLGFEIEDCGYKWNHMSMFSEHWNGSPHRYDSYIIHYAGAGIFDGNVPDKNAQIKKDKEILFKN